MLKRETEGQKWAWILSDRITCSVTRAHDVTSLVFNFVRGKVATTKPQRQTCWGGGGAEWGKILEFTFCISIRDQVGRLYFKTEFLAISRVAWKLGVCHQTLPHAACQGPERSARLRAPGRQPDGGRRANSEERPRPDTQDCTWSRVCTASRRVGALPTPTTVRLPFSGPFYSPPRLRLTVTVHRVLLKRHQMGLKGSKPTRRWFSDGLLKWFRSQRVLPQTSTPTKPEPPFPTAPEAKLQKLWAAPSRLQGFPLRARLLPPSSSFCRLYNFLRSKERPYNNRQYLLVLVFT